MKGFFEKGASPPNWKDYLTEDMEVDVAAINNYIQEALEANLSPSNYITNQPNQTASGGERPFEVEIIGLINGSVLRMRFRENIEIDQIKLMLDPCELLVQLEQASFREQIPLPFKALPQSAKAFYRDNTIEIHIAHDTRKQYVPVAIMPV